MNRIVNRVATTKNFVARHKTSIAVATTATVMYVMHSKSLAQHNEFLKEHGLYEEFYTPENSY